MPTIQAAGWPTSAQESVASAVRAPPIPPRPAFPPSSARRRRRRPAAGRAPAARTSARPRSRATPSARSTEAASSCRPRPTRPATAPSISAVIPAARPVIVRSWPAAAVETWRSLAAFASTGDITITAAWPANRHRKRATLTAPYPPPVVSARLCHRAPPFSCRLRRQAAGQRRVGGGEVRGKGRRPRGHAACAVTSRLYRRLNRSTNRAGVCWARPIRHGAGRQQKEEIQ